MKIARCDLDGLASAFMRVESDFFKQSSALWII